MRRGVVRLALTFTLIASAWAMWTAPLVPDAMADDAILIKRLWIQGSDGALRHRDLVAPSQDSLIAMGERAVPYLLPYLHTEDARERHAITDIFKGIGSAAVPALLEVIGTAGEYHTLNVLRAFGKIADSTATPRMRTLLNHDLASIRGQAAEAIGKSGGPDALVSLYSVLHDTIGTVRKSAVVGLGRIAMPESADTLVVALSDAWYGVRYPAALSLVGLDSGRTANAYMARLDGRPLAVLLHAAGTLKATHMANGIWSHVRHPVAAVRVEAAYALWSFAAQPSDGSRLASLLDAETHPLAQSFYKKALARIDE